MHWIQANRAFQVDSANVRFFGITDHGYGAEGEPAWVTLTPLPGGEPQCWGIADGGRLRDVLGRADLTRHEGRPLVVTNAEYRILGIAVGPMASVRRLVLSPIFHMKNHTLEAGRPDQPDWWLFDAVPPSPSS